MDRTTPWRSPLNTILITRLSMCKTEARHCVPLRARTLSHVWALLELCFHNFLHFFGACRNLEFALNIQQHRPCLRVKSSLDGARAFVCSQVQSSRPSTLCAWRMDVNIASHRPCVHMPDGRGVGSNVL